MRAESCKRMHDVDVKDRPALLDSHDLLRIVSPTDLDSHFLSQSVFLGKKNENFLSVLPCLRDWERLTSVWSLFSKKIEKYVLQTLGSRLLEQEFWRSFGAAGGLRCETDRLQFFPERGSSWWKNNSLMTKCRLIVWLSGRWKRWSEKRQNLITKEQQQKMSWSCKWKNASSSSWLFDRMNRLVIQCIWLLGSGKRVITALRVHPSNFN